MILYFLQQGSLHPPVAPSDLKMKVVFVHSFVDPLWSFLLLYLYFSHISVCSVELYLLVFSHWAACFVLVFSIHLVSQQLFFIVLVVQINAQLLPSNVYVITATGKEEYETIEGRCCYFSLTGSWLFDEWMDMAVVNCTVSWSWVIRDSDFHAVTEFSASKHCKSSFIKMWSWKQLVQ